MFDSDQEQGMDNSPSVCTEITRAFGEERRADNRLEAYTSFSRTAMSPSPRSIFSREVESTLSVSPVHSEMSPSHPMSATTEVDFTPTPVGPSVNKTENKKKLHPGWKLGGPYYRSDGPASHYTGTAATRQPNEPMYPPGISEGWTGTLDDNQTAKCTMTWEATGATGMLTPPCFDPRWNSPQSASVPYGGWASPGSSWGSSPVMGAYAGGAGSPITQLNPTLVQVGSCPVSYIPPLMPSPGTSPHSYIPYLPKPTPKKSAKLLRDQSIHGEKMRSIADAQRLWSRLDEESPRDNREPEQGFSAVAVQMAKY